MTASVRTLVAHDLRLKLPALKDPQGYRPAKHSCGEEAALRPRPPQAAKAQSALAHRMAAICASKDATHAPVPIILRSAIAGADKMDDPTLIDVEKMLHANDVAGLKAAASGSGPLRSLATALKCGHTLLSPRYKDSVAPGVAAALKTVRHVYESCPDLIALGNESAFDANRKWFPDQIDQLMGGMYLAKDAFAKLEQAVTSAAVLRAPVRLARD